MDYCTRDHLEFGRSLVMRSSFIAVMAAGLVGVVCLAGGVPAANQLSEPTLTAPEIISKNLAARGGLEAWRKIQTMAWAGHMESPNSPVTDMRFVLEQERPNKTRFEEIGRAH